MSAPPPVAVTSTPFCEEESVPDPQLNPNPAANDHPLNRRVASDFPSWLAAMANPVIALRVNRRITIFLTLFMVVISFAFCVWLQTSASLQRLSIGRKSYLQITGIPQRLS